MLPSELLEQGWVNRTPKSGEYCLGTAFVTSHKWSVESMKVLHTLIEGPSIIQWNDTPGRTKEEVIAVARLAEMKLGLRPMETEGEGFAVVAHALVN